MAQKSLLPGGRQDAAQLAIMTLSHGKPPFLFQINELVLQLADKHTDAHAKLSFFVSVPELM